MLNLKERKSLSFRVLVSVIQICFISSFIAPSYVLAQSPADLSLPKPGTMVQLSSAYVPVLIKGLKVHPENPILFDFLVDAGNSGITSDNAQLRRESERLIKYFLASLTIPEQDLWVNLSPYEKNRIVPEALGQTEMGRDMLAQDYLLKQLTASMIYPEKDLGKAFWNKVYAKSQQLYGTNNIPMNTFNKVWIIADKAKVYVHNNTAFVVKSHLKVMLEEDYVALSKRVSSRGGEATVAIFNEKIASSPSAPRNDTNALGSQIIRDIILPELETEINQGQNFANLRQIFNSMILATWYKKNLKEALLNQVYANQNKTTGLEYKNSVIASPQGAKQSFASSPSASHNDKEFIYEQYLKAYKKGVFNYIKEDAQSNGQVTPRKYFSGGVIGEMVIEETRNGSDSDVTMLAAKVAEGDSAMFSVSTTTKSADQSMMSVPKPEDFGVDPETAEAWRLATPRKASVEFAKLSVEQRGKGFKFIPSEFKKPSDLKRFVGQKGVVIDIGGTNLKMEEQIVEETADGQINIRVLGQPLYVPLAKNIREEWTGEQKINFFVERLAQWIVEKGIESKVLGIAFSFDQQKGVVLPGAHGSKGWNWADLVGKDLYQMINKKLEEKEGELDILLPRVTAITNDSESTAAFGDGGKITGTGANEFMWDEANGQGYNIESGKQDTRELYTADELKTSSLELDGRIEAIMAAKHFGRLAWIRIRKLVKEEGFFANRILNKIAMSFLADDYNEENGLSSQEITSLAVLDNVEQVREKLTSWGIVDPTLKETEHVWKIAKDIVRRSIWLNAAQLWGQAQLFKKADKPMDMIVDGSLWKNSGYLQAVQGLLDQWSTNLMKLRYVEGATQKGTLILALSNADLMMNASILTTNVGKLIENGSDSIPMTGVSFDHGDFIKTKGAPQKVGISRVSRTFFHDNEVFDGLYVGKNRAVEVIIPEFSKVLVLGPWVIIVDPGQKTLRLAVANSINHVLINPNNSEQVRTAFGHVPLNSRNMFWRATTRLDKINLSKTQLSNDGKLSVSFTDGRKDAVLDLAKVSKEVFGVDLAMNTNINDILQKIRGSLKFIKEGDLRRLGEVGKVLSVDTRWYSRDEVSQYIAGRMKDEEKILVGNVANAHGQYEVFIVDQQGKVIDQIPLFGNIRIYRFRDLLNHNDFFVVVDNEMQTTIDESPAAIESIVGSRSVNFNGSTLIIRVQKSILEYSDLDNVLTEVTIDHGDKIRKIKIQRPFNEDPNETASLITTYLESLKPGSLKSSQLTREIIKEFDVALMGNSPGGIDLNSRNMQMDVEGQEINLRFDAAMMSQFQQGNFSGIRPQIIKVTPILNMRPLLGLAPAKEPEQLAKV